MGFLQAYNLQDLFSQASLNRFYNVKLVEHVHDDNHSLKRYHWQVLDEALNPNPKVFITNEKNGFYIVGKDESVIFYLYSDSERHKFF